MSFSSDIKNELCAKGTGNKCCMRAELAAFILFSARFDNDGIRILTENPFVAKRAYSFFKSVYNADAAVSVTQRSVSESNSMYYVNINEKYCEDILTDLCIARGENGEREFRIYNGMVKNECCIKSFVKGAYLAAGSMTDPKKDYHLEFVTHRKRLSGDFVVLLKKFGLEPGVVVRKSNYVVYFKAADAISDVLTVIGAVHSLMEFENTQIEKDFKNKVNRMVNCETANLQKTADASAKQLAAINKIKESGKWDALPESLSQLCEIRLSNPELSLSEICRMTGVSKSGVNHRFRKIISIADGIDNG